MNGFKKDESFIEKVNRGEELSFIVADSCYSIECKVQKNKLRGLGLLRSKWLNGMHIKWIESVLWSLP